MIAFQFPPLGNTGQGPVVPVNRQLPLDRQAWDDSLPMVWKADSDYYITRQEDNPACAYRCHYPGGSSPCDRGAALDFAIWVSITPPDQRTTR